MGAGGSVAARVRQAAGTDAPEAASALASCVAEATMRLAASLSGAPVSSSYRASATSCAETIAASRVAEPSNATHNPTTSTPTTARCPITRGVRTHTQCDVGPVRPSDDTSDLTKFLLYMSEAGRSGRVDQH